MVREEELVQKAKEVREALIEMAADEIDATHIEVGQIKAKDNARKLLTVRVGGANRYVPYQGHDTSEFTVGDYWAIIFDDYGTIRLGWWVTNNAGGGTIPSGPHAPTHEDGGADEISVAALSGLLVDDQHVLDAEVLAVAAALVHAARHENGGADEISVAALSGLLADDQHVLDAEVLAVAAALAHKARHISGGADAFANTDLLEAIIKRIQVTGPVTLTMGAVADGQFLKRVGAGIVGAAAGGNGAEAIFGSCYGNHIAWVQAGAVQNTWYNISDADIADGELQGVTHDGSGKLTVPDSGEYLILYALCYLDNIANNHVEVGIEIDGSGAAEAAGRTHSETKFANQEEHLSGCVILDLTADETIELAIRTIDVGGPNITIDGMNLAVYLLAGGVGVAHDILDGAVHTDSVADAVTRGSIIVGNATPKWDELVIGAANRALLSDGADPSWGQVSHTDLINKGEPFTEHLSNPACGAYHDANQSLLNGIYTILALNSERFDTDTMHDLVVNNSRITFNTVGIYVVNARIVFADNAVGHRMLQILYNGIQGIGEIRQNAVVGITTNMNCISIWEMSAGDFVQMAAQQTSGGALNVMSYAGISPELAAVRVG